MVIKIKEMLTLPAHDFPFSGNDHFIFFIFLNITPYFSSKGLNMARNVLLKATIIEFMRLSRSHQIRIANNIGIELPENHRQSSLTWTIAFLSVVQKRGWADNLTALMTLEKAKKG